MTTSFMLYCIKYYQTSFHVKSVQIFLFKTLAALQMEFMFCHIQDVHSPFRKLVAKSNCDMQAKCLSYCNTRMSLYAL